MSSNGSLLGSGRRRISDESLHISSFVVVQREPGSVLLIKATDAHPLTFRRGELLLPATMLQFGEKPVQAAERAVATQLSGAEGLEHKFMEIQSYMGSHWDICLVYEFDAGRAGEIKARAPYADAAFYRLDSLPRGSIAEDHLEVIDGLMSAQSD
jgi:ADP-ribose pyrophosphatase YjhB (NUDIX family)